MYQVLAAVCVKSRLYALRRLWLITVVLCLGFASSAIVWAAPAEQQPGSRVGNILLRDYFLERYLELHGERTMFPGSPAVEERMKDQDDPIAEQFIDTQVDQFINDLEHKIDAMKSTAKKLETVRDEAVAGRSTDDPATRTRLQELARDVGARAGDIFNMVALVVVDLRPKGNVQPPPSKSGVFLEGELKFLLKQVGKAEGRLKQLFLEPTHTVDLDELRGDNVLTELKSIEEVSKDIKKKTVDSSPHTDRAE